MTSANTQKMKFAVAATYTAEPLLDSLSFWNQKLGWQADIEFAPYNQVFQQLLDPASLVATNRKGANILLVRPEDWVRYGADQNNSEAVADSATKIQQTAQQLVNCVRSAAQRSLVPYFVCLCPSSPDGVVAGYLAAEEHIYAELQNVAGVQVFSSTALLTSYSVSKYYDAERDAVAHIPYTAEFFAALGTVICRRLYSLQQPPAKVIALDCDETLWAGICGEVGPRGINVDSGRQYLQRFMVGQEATGTLLCLCSKNNPEDVDEVFQCQTEMPLKQTHIAASRVNWQPKPANLRELASELQLGLDSFIFLDDSPVECEQMKLSCPEVVTLQLPPDNEKIQSFLDNVWAFDKQKVTEEDRQRTILYRQNRDRELFRQAAPTLESFLAGLQLQCTIAPLTLEQLARVSQLTVRTNQFNCTTVRRSEDQILQPWKAGELECLTVSVSDRFGHYGLVGAMMFCSTPEALKVDSFLLSCRVLGRGVEHRMLRNLGEVAFARGIPRIDIRFLPSKKNSPALSFLESVAGQFKHAEEVGYWFRVPAEYAAKLSNREVISTLQVAVDGVQQQPERLAHASAAVAPSDLMQEIATKLIDAKTILAAIEQGKGLSGLPQPDSGGQPTNVREAIVDNWRRVLGTSDIGPDDDFFSLGGDSLPAIQVLIRLNQVFGVSLELQDIFDHPTVSGLASVIEGALRNKRCSESARKPGPSGGSSELEAAAVAAAKTDKSEDDFVSASVLARNTPALQAIEQRTQKGPCALSFAQESWWFLNQWAPTSSDLSSCVLRLRGALNVAALQHALNQFVKRHEALRTVFQATEHGPVQVVRDPICMELPIIDLGDAEPGTERRAENIVEDEASKPFDLASDLMLRPTLLRLAGDDHILILIAHHIAFDAASRETLLHELEILYSAFVQGQPDPLPALTTQYADYAVWQRNLIGNGGLQGQLDYWKQRLAGIPARIELPRDRNTTSAQLCRGAQKSAILPNQLATALRSLAQREGVTMFMLLLAAFQTLLHRYSAQDDVVVGSPDSGRSHPQTEGVVGCFVNVLLFRTDFSGNPTFRELLARVRELVLQVRSNQEVPLPKLVQELEPGRNMNQSPLFQVIFAFEKALTAPQLPGLEVSVRELDTRTALHDVSLFAAEVPQGLRLKFECKKEVFESATIERMLAHMSTLLHEIVADPDRHVSTLPILTRNEEEQLTRGWNSFQNYPVKNCIHELFETQVQRAPQQVALVFEQQEITYAELNARANQVAHYLERMGVGPEVLVGLCVERSIDMVVAILGILKAGGAYLPLDPSYPKDRLQFMLSDAKPPVVVTQYELKELFPEFDGQILALDADWPEIGQESTANMERPARPENLAYVIYTSGSTGRPKGCQITHHNIVRLFEATWTWYQFDASDVWTMFHSYAFDFSVWELWGALIYGGRLVLVPYLVSRSPEDFYQLVKREKVTVLNQTPSSFKQLMNADARLGGGNRLSLRYVIFGGEALEMQSLRPWFQRHGDQKPRLVNMYGITETTVHVTYRPLSLADTEGGSVIGCPLPDLQLYLLDRYRQPVPVGVPGELYVGGAGVARGYLNRPELTAERFIRDPFRPDAQARLYKTGDSARRLGNGDVEYLGRIDQQVKIRGFRIELGEIEAVLARHRDVRESVVVVSENESGDKRLVAYVVPRDGAVPTSGDLYVFLKEQLPEYMVPSAFVMLHNIPLTSNGKVDRRALPEPTTSRPEQEIGFVAPRTPLEEEVASAWTQVLELEQVGIHDNFFEIGGHSLLATRVITRLRANLGVNLSLRLLFENPTIASMALVLVEILLDHCDQLQMEELINRVEGLSDETAQQMRSNLAATEIPVDQPL